MTDIANFKEVEYDIITCPKDNGIFPKDSIKELHTFPRVKIN